MEAGAVAVQAFQCRQPAVGRSIAFQMAEITVPRTLSRQILNANAIASVVTSPMLRNGDTTGRVDQRE